MKFIPGLVSVTFRQLDPSQIVTLVARAGLKAIEWGGDIHAPPADLQKVSDAGRLSREGGNDLLTFKLAEQMRDPAESPGCLRLHGSQTASLPPGVWYADWAAQYGLSGTNALYTADPDGDGIPNLLEHASGGNPDSPNDNPQIFRLTPGSARTNGFEFNYRRQRYAASKGLSYRLESSTNLFSDTWDPLEFVETGATIISPDIESVTTRTPAANVQEFIRLKITSVIP